ncbi:hypothetical protein JCM10213_003800 [Rhodosporidiobolus nylandii]
MPTAPPVLPPPQPDMTLIINPDRVAVAGPASLLAAAALLAGEVDEYNSRRRKVNPATPNINLQARGVVGIVLLRQHAQMGVAILQPTPGGQVPIEFSVGPAHIPPSDLPAIRLSLMRRGRSLLANVPGYVEAAEHHSDASEALLVPRVIFDRGMPGWSQPFVRHDVVFSLRPTAEVGTAITAPLLLPPTGHHRTYVVKCHGHSASALLYFALRSLWHAKEPHNHPDPSSQGLSDERRAAVAGVQSFLILILVDTESQALYLLQRDPRFAVQRLDHAGDDGPVSLQPFKRLSHWVLTALRQAPQPAQGAVGEISPRRMLAEEAVTYLTPYMPRLQTDVELLNEQPERQRMIMRFELAFGRVYNLFFQHAEYACARREAERAAAGGSRS